MPSRPTALFSRVTSSAPPHVKFVRLRSALIICFFLAFSNPVLAGSQRDAVCQGSCGGGCGPCGGSPNYSVPQYVAPSPSVQINEQGNQALHNGDNAEAERLYRQALQLNPSDDVIRNNVALAINAQGNDAYNKRDWVEAERLYRLALQISPHDVTMRRNLAVTITERGLQYYRNEEFSLAERFFRTANRISPNDRTIVNNIGFAVAGGICEKAAAAEKIDNYPLAVMLYEKARRATPRNTIEYAETTGKLYNAIAVRNTQLQAARQAQLQAEQNQREELARQKEQQERQARQEAEAKRQQDALAAADLKKGVQGVAGSIQPVSPPANASGLDFLPGNNGFRDALNDSSPASGSAKLGVSNNPNGLAATDTSGIDQSDHSGQFGTKVVKNPDIGPAESTTLTRYKSNSEIASAAIKNPGVFDGRPGGPTGEGLVSLNRDWSPAANALASQLEKNPDAKNNQIIWSSLQWYLSQDRLITQKQGQIAALQKKIDNGEGNPKDLNDKKASFEGEIKRARIDQENTVKQIKEEAGKRHFEINWQEITGDNTNQAVDTKSSSIPKTNTDRVSNAFQVYETPESKSVKIIKAPEPGR
jgi:tetratricopeptide (TPR) repeat protein